MIENLNQDLKDSLSFAQKKIESLSHENWALTLALIANISSQKRSEAALKVIQVHLSQIISTTSDALIVLTMDGCVRFVNPAAESLFGRSKEQLLDHCLGIPCTAGETTEISIIQPGGGSLLAEMKVTEIPWDDEIAYLASLRDITERHHAQQQLHHQAFHDSLTNLPNRALFLDRLKHALQLQKRQPLSSIVVLFLDLDRFKLINDSFGHLVGDQLLKAFADRLQMNLRTCDTLARLGGDEFAILLEDLSDSEEALQIAQRIQDQLRSPFKIIDQELFANVSIGIALDITDYEEPEQLLRDADTAMYRAKFLGRGRYVVFDPEMRQESINRLQLENELRRALEQQELVAFYQPVVNLATGKPTGFEALIRWQHPQRGLLLPSQFVPLAEETGLIVQIDRWILAEACRQLKNQQIKHCHSEALTVNVNLSSRHLTDTTLPDYLTQILQDTGLDARNLRLELTETALIQNLEKATSLLHQIRDMHIQLCLDDFGTGYSSLSYLHRFPVSCLKIDRSFVCNMHSKLENWEIIRTIITLANTLGLDTVAEGIETYQQCSQLKSLGCSKGQGYFFYEPSALLIT